MAGYKRSGLGISGGVFQKMFAVGTGIGSSRVPLKSNVFGGGAHGRGYSPIGQSGRGGQFTGVERRSPLLGNSTPSNRMSGYYERVAELRSYRLLDITRLAINLFRDYVLNFLIRDGRQIVTITNEDGEENVKASERINTILTKDLKLFDFIEDHIDDSIFYGAYCAMIQTSPDETGHTKFRIEELYDPISVVVKKKKNEEGIMEETYLARGEDGVVYEIPRNEAFYLGSTNLRLINDLEEDWKDKTFLTPRLEEEKKKEDRNNRLTENRKKVMVKEYYAAGEPLFYSLIMKVKELVVKELLISLLSLRDLASPSLYALPFDKSVPLETASDLCSKAQKLATVTNELASFVTGQFDVVSFIESAITQNVKFIPDYGASLSNKNSILPMDKLSEKLLELMQTLDMSRQGILSSIGIPSSIFDSTTGSKWAILQQSERANSKVSSLMDGIKGSVIDMVSSIYRVLYNEEIDSSNIDLHLFERSTVEYNNQINQSESINSLVQGVGAIVQGAIGTLEAASPLIDADNYLGWIQGLIRDVDPSANGLVTAESLERYLILLKAKIANQYGELGIDLPPEDDRSKGGEEY